MVVRPIVVARIVLGVTLGVGALALLQQVGLGPDFATYRQWTYALLRGDIFAIRGHVAATSGVPLSLASPGPGAVLAAGDAAFGRRVFGVRGDLLLCWLGVLAMGWALVGLLRRLTEGNRPLVLLLAAVGFLGTPLGYYAAAYASETMTLVLLALLAYWVVCRERWGLFDALVVGALGGLLIWVRAQLAPYVLVGGGLVAFRLYRQHTPPARWLLLGSVSAIGLLAGALPVLLVNQWMMGSYLSSAYQFGDEAFHSVDWAHPNLLAVLAHPWHGLLAYHPWYLLGFGAGVYLLMTRRPLAERLAYASVLVVVLLHVYLQGAWYCWWLGLNTFGMRGLAVTAVPLLALSAIMLTERIRQGRRIWDFLVLTLVAVVWSFLLYLQGVTNFMTYGGLLRGQWGALKEPLTVVSLAVSGVIGVLGALRGGDRKERWLVGSAAGVASLWLNGVLGHWVVRLLSGREQALWAVWLWVGIVVAVGVALVTWLRAPGLQARLRRAPEIVIGTLFACVLAHGSYRFFVLARNTEQYLSEDPPRRKRFRRTSDVLWPELEKTYLEYLGVPGFEEDKARLKGFLDRHPGPERHHRHRHRHRRRHRRRH